MGDSISVLISFRDFETFDEFFALILNVNGVMDWMYHCECVIMFVDRVVVVDFSRDCHNHNLGYFFFFFLRSSCSGVLLRCQSGWGEFQCMFLQGFWSSYVLLDFCLADRLPFLVTAAKIPDVCHMMRPRGNGIGCCRTWFLILSAANCHLEEEEFDLSTFGTGQCLWFLVWLSITRNNGRETVKCCPESNSTGAQYVCDLAN